MTFRAGYCQFAPVFGDVDANLGRVIEALEEADADMVVLPELPFTGYSFTDRQELDSLAEDPSRSEITDTLNGICRRRDMHVVTGFAEKAGDRIFNSSLLIGPTGILSTYRKMHLFNREFQYFDRGDTPLSVTHVDGIGVGMMICFDWVYPEAARILALHGADLLVHPSNLVLTYCQDAMVTRCLENSVYAVTANRTGTEKRDGLETPFTGQSQVTAPDGTILHRGSADSDETFVTGIDPGLARDKRMTPGNDLLADRRPGLYGRLTEKADPRQEEK
jgi:predicted amidohydrolase